MEQHFLKAKPAKALIQEAHIDPLERVLELGAGIGSVARHLPACRSLTLVERDPKLVAHLYKNLSGAEVLEADALEVMGELEFEVLFSNLPHALSSRLLDRLAHKSFRIALLAVKADDDLNNLPPTLHCHEVMLLHEDDFCPRQPFKSRVVAITLSNDTG